MKVKLKLKTVVFFRGNPAYGTPEMHKKLESEIKELAEEAGYVFVPVESDSPVVPNVKGDIYIGFSRGTRYFKKIKGIKIGIGSKFGTYNFVNNDDKTSQGDISKESLEAHFRLSEDTKRKILKILKNKG